MISKNGHPLNACVIPHIRMPGVPTLPLSPFPTLCPIVRGRSLHLLKPTHWELSYQTGDSKMEGLV